MCPPVRNGSIDSSSSARPRARRHPLGPHILWAEMAAKSQPSACTSTRRCGAAWAASATITAPCSCAHAASRSTGLTVPSEFETTPVATTLAEPSEASSSSVSRLQLAVVVERDHAEACAGASPPYCQGT